MARVGAQRQMTARRYVSPDNLYMYAATRLHTPDRAQAAPVNKEFQLHQLTIGLPPYPVRNPRFFIPAFYTVNTGSTPSEFAAPNAITYQGLTINVGGTPSGSQIVGGATFRARVNGEQSWVADPALGPGVWTDPIETVLPANATIYLRTACGVEAGQSFITGQLIRTSIGESNQGAATSLEAGLTSWASLPFTAGVLGIGPAFMVGQSIGRDNRPVFFTIGSSVFWGGAEHISATSPRGVIGGIHRGLDDNSNGQRFAYGNNTVPGITPLEWSDPTKLARRLAAIDLLPNRPFTHIISDTGFNGIANQEYKANLRTWMRNYFNWVQKKWPFVPIYGVESVPHPTTSDLWTSLEGQGYGGDYDAYFAGDFDTVYAEHPNAVRTLFNHDIGGEQGNEDAAAFFRTQGYLAGSFPMWKTAGADTSTNRYKWKLNPFSTTLAAEHTSGTTFSFTDAPALGESVVFGDPPANLSVISAVSGSGPYTVTVVSGVTPTFAAGTLVRGVYCDAAGVHPNTSMHLLLAQAFETWKDGRFM